jgi:hypothetical protein
MAEKEAEKDHEVVILYGEAFGWVDVQNLQKYLDERCCTDCWVYLQKAPVGRVQQTVDEDERIQIRVSDKPKKSAQNFYDELQQNGQSSKMMRLEQVSDRSMNKGAC